MSKPQFIFFDVGNTLLFPNRDLILAPLPEDRRPTLDGWRALERRTKSEFDRGVIRGTPDHGFWWTFHTYLLEQINSASDQMRNTLVKNTQNSANWDQILPGTRDALERIRQRYATAVISNPAIFAAALREMNADPAQTLYVGDVYSVDYMGARAAGMQALLFDVAGAYRGQQVPRVESLSELESWLTQNE
jgi:FMN phosphatase YigB (HAD superfamily)